MRSQDDDAQMNTIKDHEKDQYVNKTFNRIAARYDLLNRLMTAGQDIRWRREAIARLHLNAGDYLLDIGCGTGDLSREAIRRQPALHLTSADFTLKMMQVGNDTGNLPWVNADTQKLPFTDSTFDAIVSGFLMRNVGDLAKALEEQYRVLKPGGRLVILETTPPRNNALRPFIRFYMRIIIPLLGQMIARDAEAYHYLPESSESFLNADAFAQALTTAGFTHVGYHYRMFGAIALHWGQKGPR